MTQHVATVEFVHVAQGAESPGGAPLGAEASYSLPAGGLAFTADPEGGTGVVLRLPALWGAELVAADLSFLIATGMVAAHAIEGTQLWVNHKAAANIRLGNTAGELTLVSRPRYAASNGYLYPVPMVRISGAAKADYGALAAGDFAEGRITYRRMWGKKITAPVLGAMFLDTAVGDSLTDPTSFLRRVERQVNSGAPQVLAPGSTATAPIYVMNGGATFIANDPLGVVFVAPGDIGPGVNQLPTTILNNTAAAYAQFPSVWIVASSLVNAVRLVEARTEAVTAAFGEMTILQVNRAPTYSLWQLDYNGACLEVIVKHPTGSDLRTGKAIFDAVWRPLLFGGAVGQGPVTYSRVFGSSWVYTPNGVLNNCSLIRALRLIEPQDESSAALYSVIVQT